MDQPAIFTLTIRRDPEQDGKFVAEGHSDPSIELTGGEILEYLHACVAGAVYNARSMAEAMRRDGHQDFPLAMELAIAHAVAETTIDDQVQDAVFKVEAIPKKGVIMKVIAACKAVDTGNCIAAQVEVNYHGKISEHGQMFAVMIKAIYASANDMLSKLPEQSRIVFAKAMADSLGGLHAAVLQQMDFLSLEEINQSDLKEVVEKLSEDAQG
jgi:hypothetical protein